MIWGEPVGARGWNVTWMRTVSVDTCIWTLSTQLVVLWDCGTFRSQSLAGGGTSLRVGFESSEPHPIPLCSLILVSAWRCYLSGPCSSWLPPCLPLHMDLPSGTLAKINSQVAFSGGGFYSQFFLKRLLLALLSVPCICVVHIVHICCKFTFVTPALWF